jgi:hypothetical protein
MERVRLVEEAVLKTVSHNRYGGSIPSLSAKPHRFLKLVRVIKNIWRVDRAVMCWLAKPRLR